MIERFNRNQEVTGDFVVGKKIRIEHPDSRKIYDVEITLLTDSALEFEILNQVIDLGNGKEALIFGEMEMTINGERII
jgi:hypothetical protein